MGYPSFEEYTDALRLPPGAVFQDPLLAAGSVRKGTAGVPFARSGNFALTYEVTCNGARYAVRCFHKESDLLERRYEAIARKLKSVGGPFFVDFEFQPAGIRTESGQYPIVRMQWADGCSLAQFISDHRDEPQTLLQLRETLRALARHLETNDIGHGDIQSGNILVRSATDLKLIDYDGMYVPELEPWGSTELGQRNFQHPGRSWLHFDERLDRFSFALLDVALEALAMQPALWELTGSDEAGIVLRASDFADPAASTTFGVLTELDGMRIRARHLAALCRSPFERVPALDDFIAGRRIPASAPPGVAGNASAKIPYLPPYAVLQATNFARCCAHIGDRIELIGRVRRVVREAPIDGGAAALRVEFGDAREDMVRLVIWPDVAQAGVPGLETGQWLSAIGLVDPILTETSGDRPYKSVSIAITEPSQLRLLTEAEATRRLSFDAVPQLASDDVSVMIGTDPALPGAIARPAPQSPPGAMPLATLPAEPTPVSPPRSEEHVNVQADHSPARAAPSPVRSVTPPANPVSVNSSADTKPASAAMTQAIPPPAEHAATAALAAAAGISPATRSANSSAPTVHRSSGPVQSRFRWPNLRMPSLAYLAGGWTMLRRRLPIADSWRRVAASTAALRRALPDAATLRRALPDAGALRRALPDAAAVHRGLQRTAALRKALPNVASLRQSLPGASNVRNLLPPLHAALRAFALPPEAMSRLRRVHPAWWLAAVLFGVVLVQTWVIARKSDSESPRRADTAADSRAIDIQPAPARDGRPRRASDIAAGARDARAASVGKGSAAPTRAPTTIRRAQEHAIHGSRLLAFEDLRSARRPIATIAGPIDVVTKVGTSNVSVVTVDGKGIDQSVAESNELAYRSVYADREVIVGFSRCMGATPKCERKEPFWLLLRKSSSPEFKRSQGLHANRTAGSVTAAPSGVHVELGLWDGVRGTATLTSLDDIYVTRLPESPGPLSGTDCRAVAAALESCAASRACGSYEAVVRSVPPARMTAVKRVFHETTGLNAAMFRAVCVRSCELGLTPTAGLVRREVCGGAAPGQWAQVRLDH